MDSNKALRIDFRGYWAILPSVLATLQAAAEAGSTNLASWSEPSAPAPRGGSIAVLPVYGPISYRPSWFAGTSVQAFTQQFRALLADNAVRAIALDIDSPGGEISGIQELSDEIYRARGRKPIVASANSLCASAAYWIACSADEVVVTPSGEIGSVGVVGIHTDFSGQLEKAGIRTTLISAGKRKAELSPFGPLADEARAHVQARCDELHEMFVGSIARGRGKAAGEVREGFGQGRLVGAKQALKFGMVDSIATLDEVVSRLARSSRSAMTAARSPQAGRWTADAGIDTRRRLRLAARG